MRLRARYYAGSANGSRWGDRHSFVDGGTHMEAWQLAAALAHDSYATAVLPAGDLEEGGSVQVFLPFSLQANVLSDSGSSSLPQALSRRADFISEQNAWVPSDRALLDYVLTGAMEALPDHPPPNLPLGRHDFALGPHISVDAAQFIAMNAAAAELCPAACPRVIIASCNHFRAACNKTALERSRLQSHSELLTPVEPAFPLGWKKEQDNTEDDFEVVAVQRYTVCGVFRVTQDPKRKSERDKCVDDIMREHGDGILGGGLVVGHDGVVQYLKYGRPGRNEEFLKSKYGANDGKIPKRHVVVNAVKNLWTPGGAVGDTVVNKLTLVGKQLNGPNGQKHRPKAGTPTAMLHLLAGTGACEPAFSRTNVMVHAAGKNACDLMVSGEKTKEVSYGPVNGQKSKNGSTAVVCLVEAKSNRAFSGTSREGRGGRRGTKRGAESGSDTDCTM